MTVQFMLLFVNVLVLCLNSAMAIETIHLLTGNPDKLKAARVVFDDYDIPVEALRDDAPEIQAATSKEIARYAVNAAYQELGVSVLREDHSFYIDELGIPGPFMAYMDKAVSVDQLISIVDTLRNRRAHFNIAAAFMSCEGELFETEYDVPVVIASEARGNPDLNWERAMILEGSDKTFAESPSEDREHLWQQNYREIARFIIDNS